MWRRGPMQDSILFFCTQHRPSVSVCKRHSLLVLSLRMISDQSWIAWRVSLTVLHTISMGATVYRYYERWRRRALWFDDFTALAAMIMDGFLVITLWSWMDPDGSAPLKLLVVITFWLWSILSTAVVWFARISLALAIARIYPPGAKYRRLAIIESIVFFLFGLELVLHLIITCAHDTSWVHSPSQQCDFGEDLGLASLSFDIIADVLLIATPLSMLRDMSMPRAQKRLVLTGFAASMVTSLASVALTVFLISPPEWGPNAEHLVLMLSHVMAIIGLLACNLLVIITSFYRTIRTSEDPESSYPSKTTYAREYSSGLFTGPSTIPPTTIVLTEISSMPASSSGCPPSSYNVAHP